MYVIYGQLDMTDVVILNTTAPFMSVLYGALIPRGVLALPLPQGMRMRAPCGSG